MIWDEDFYTLLFFAMPSDGKYTFYTTVAINANMCNGDYVIITKAIL